MKTLFVAALLALLGQEGAVSSQKPTTECGCRPSEGQWHQNCVGLRRGACAYYRDLGDCYWAGRACPNRNSDDNNIQPVATMAQGYGPPPSHRRLQGGTCVCKTRLIRPCTRQVRQACTGLGRASCAAYGQGSGESGECTWIGNGRRLAESTLEEALAGLTPITQAEALGLASTRRRLAHHCVCKLPNADSNPSCENCNGIVGQASCSRYSEECGWRPVGRRLADESDELDANALGALSTRRRLGNCSCRQANGCGNRCRNLGWATCMNYRTECSWSGVGRRLAVDAEDRLPMGEAEPHPLMEGDLDATRRRLTQCMCENTGDGTTDCGILDGETSCIYYRNQGQGCDWICPTDPGQGRRLGENLIEAEFDEVELDAELAIASVPLRRRLHGHCSAIVGNSQFAAICNGIPIADSCHFYTHECVWIDWTVTGAASPSDTDEQQALSSRRLVDVSAGACVSTQSVDNHPGCAVGLDAWSCFSLDACTWNVDSEARRLAEMEAEFS